VDDPEYAFPDVSALIVAEDGAIYTLHRQSVEIRRWTADGLAAGSVGGAGQGPGEFNRPSGMGWQGDSIWVFDSSNYRITFFDGEGTFLGSLSPRVDMGSTELALEAIYPPRPQGLLRDGSLFGVPPAPADDVVSGRLTRLGYMKMDEDGRILDTLAVIPVGRENTLGVLSDVGGTFAPQPFGDAAEARVTSDGSGMVVLDRRAAELSGPAEFRVTRVDLAGDTLWSRAYGYEPVPLPRIEVESSIQEIAGRLHEFVGERTGTSLSQWLGWVGEAIHAPAHYPPVTRLGAGRDGTVWLELNPPPLEGPEWMVVAEDGEPLARTRVPEGFQWMTADRDAIWGIERDALDVPYIVRYGITLP
jgi:hypothetical protein